MPKPDGCAQNLAPKLQSTHSIPSQTFLPKNPAATEGETCSGVSMAKGSKHHEGPQPRVTHTGAGVARESRKKITMFAVRDDVRSDTGGYLLCASTFSAMCSSAKIPNPGTDHSQIIMLDGHEAMCERRANPKQ